MKNYDESDGVWRTIRGRRVFIRKGESLDSAMKRSGKFNNNKNDNRKEYVGKMHKETKEDLKNKYKKRDFEQERENIKKAQEERKYNDKVQKGLTDNEIKQGYNSVEERLNKIKSNNGVNTISRNEFEKMPNDYKGNLKELVDTAEFRGENKEQLRQSYEAKGYNVDKDKTILKYDPKYGTTLQPVKVIDNETNAKVNLGKIDYYGNGRKSNAVDIEMELKDGRFSASGNIWNSRHTDIVSGGQNIDEIAEHFKGNKDVQEIHSLWKQYHLNDMHAGTQRQEEALIKKFGNQNASDYSKHVEYLKSQGLYEDNGYKYGTGWLKWDIPKQDEQRIQELINKYSKNSNNISSSSTNMKTTSTGAKVQKSAMDNTIEQFRSKKQSNVGVKPTSETTKLEPVYDSRKSFYGKAEVKQSGDLSELYSYGTLVAQKGTDANGIYYKSMGKYSQTTTRHQKEFFRQSGLTDKEIKQIMENGNLKKYNK